jgi:hypothetical protein
MSAGGRRRKLAGMNTFKHLIAGALLAGAAAAAMGPAQAGPLPNWAPNAHNFIVGPICDEIGVGLPDRHGEWCCGANITR